MQGIVLSEGSLAFSLAASAVASPGDLALRLDAASFDLGASDGNTGNQRFVFGSAGLGWAAGDTVAVRLVARRAAPAGLTASAAASEPTGIELAWEAPAGTGAAFVSGYRIEVSADGGSSWAGLVPDSGTAATAYRHGGLSANDTRHYRVSAITPAGISGPSGTASATAGRTAVWSATLTAQGIPYGFGCSNDAGAALCSDLLSDGEFSYAGATYAIAEVRIEPRGNTFEIEFGADLGPAAADLTLHYGGNELAFSSAIQDQDPDARDERFWYGPFPPWAAGETVELRVTASFFRPGAPAGLTATSDEAGVIDLAWTAPAATGAGPLTAYRIQYSSTRARSGRTSTTRATPAPPTPPSGTIGTPASPCSTGSRPSTSQAPARSPNPPSPSPASASCGTPPSPSAPGSPSWATSSGTMPASTASCPRRSSRPARAATPRNGSRFPKAPCPSASPATPSPRPPTSSCAWTRISSTATRQPPTPATGSSPGPAPAWAGPRATPSPCG